MAATTTNRELWRDALRRTLAHRAGDAPDASAVAEATASTWRQVDALLTPLIGATGVDVIFRRALSLTSKVFPWLAIGEEHGDSAALLVSLKVQLAGRDTANSFNLLGSTNMIHIQDCIHKKQKAAMAIKCFGSSAIS